MIFVACAKDSAKTQEVNKRSERERENVTFTAPICVYRNRDWLRSWSMIEIVILPIAISGLWSRLLFGFDNFFLGFVCVLRNEWYYRLVTEKMWENVSNKYKMCFLMYFQEHNQTSENIFRNIFWNTTKRMKIFSFLKNIYFLEILLHEPNATLVVKTKNIPKRKGKSKTYFNVLIVSS